jgi:hypothetical protein
MAAMIVCVVECVQCGGALNDGRARGCEGRVEVLEARGGVEGEVVPGADADVRRRLVRAMEPRIRAVRTPLRIVHS